MKWSTKDRKESKWRETLSLEIKSKVNRLRPKRKPTEIVWAKTLQTNAPRLEACACNQGTSTWCRWATEPSGRVPGLTACVSSWQAQAICVLRCRDSESQYPRLECNLGTTYRLWSVSHDVNSLGADEKSRELKILKPMIWSAPANQKNYYFCMTDVAGFTSTTTHKIQYLNVPSIVKPQKILVVEETATLELMDEDEEGMQVDDVYEENSSEDKEYFPDVVGENKDLEIFDQLELNDFVRDIGLSKERSEHLAAVLNKKNLVATGTSAYFYRDREKEFLKFFNNDSENSLGYCSDVKGLVDELKPNTYKDE
ncbi:hypothetical protein EVAR_79798_1 [Eumeta japonica]|uniref:Uncharacterized protein n=1 Tax=Eumeta variegata TaxID=151549 RepID=A0A4C1WU66_EUMVA|nr:hypothetical protein EVAR_79798_1 [Eumeta japonica]